MLLVRVLGPTTVSRDEDADIELGARRHAEVLAILAAHRGHQVRAEALADLVWRGNPPPSASTTLQGYISRLRRLLDPERTGAGTAAIVTVGDGYRLGLDTDASRFEVAVRRGRELLPSQPREAAALLADGLGQWRGRALADVDDVEALGPEIQRLDELRLVARELHAQALLAAGADAEVVPELRALVAEHPLRERAPTLLATALYRAGRQADALLVLRDLRDRLVDELGVDPGPEVAALERRLLQHDSSLAVRPPSAEPAVTTPAVTTLAVTTLAATTPAVTTPAVTTLAVTTLAATTPAVTTPAASDFAGRRSELAALHQAWARARGGSVTTVVIRGEAGIGKTRLVQELLDTAVAPTGASIRWGRCSAAEGAPAFWPWNQVLGELPALDAGMEAGRFALGLEIGDRLAGLAGETGAVIVLDDAHWADADSLLVLETALETLTEKPLLLIVTARDDHPRAPAELIRLLAALARRTGHLDLRLGGLTPDEAAPLLSNLTGDTLDPHDTGRLIGRTGGNPFFLRSLAALGPDAPVPADVRDTVSVRVSQLPPGGPELLDLLAVAGGELPVGVLAAASRASLDAIAHPSAAALGAGLIEEPSPGRLIVAHDLVREATVAGLTPPKWMALHARLADALAATDAASAVVAEHWLAAASGDPDGRDRATRAALRAATDALGAAALDDAVSWAERGLTVADDQQVQADLHRIAGVAARRAGRLEHSEAELRAEAQLARGRGDWARLAEAALESVPGGIGGYWSLYGMPLLGPNGLLDEALSHLDEVEPPLRARLLAAQATQLTGLGAPAASATAERALAEAGTDPGARARALVACVLANWTPGTADERLARLDELRPLCGSSAGLEATAAHLERAVLLELGRSAESARASRRFAAVAHRTHDPDLALLDTWWRVGLCLLRGESEEARTLAQKASQAVAVASPAAASLDLISRSTVEGITAWQEGRLIGMVGDAAALASDTDPGFLLVVALAHAEAGHASVALPIIDRLLADRPDGQRLVSWTVLLAAALTALEDGERLQQLIPTLRSFGCQLVVLWPGLVSLGPAQLYLGGALAVAGEPDEARAVLRAALQQAEEVGARPYADRARALLRQLPD